MSIFKLMFNFVSIYFYYVIKEKKLLNSIEFMIRVGDLLLSQYFFFKKYYLEVFLKVKLIFLLIIKVVFGSIKSIDVIRFIFYMI